MSSLTPAAIPPEIIAVCRCLREAGHRAYLVGGAVRDHLRLPLAEAKAAAKDFDIATSARPEEVIALFGRKSTVPTGIQHGTITVLVPRPGADGHQVREHVEVTTFRGEGAYSDGRRPDQVAFIDDLTEDLRRRDFTINAIAYDPIEDLVEDPFRGRQDLAGRRLRAVGDAAARFSEDGLRVMRAVRFAAQLGYELDPATAAAIPGALPTFRKVSAERIRDELLKLLAAPFPERGLALLRQTGLFAEVLPEVAARTDGAALLDVVLRSVPLLPRDAVLRLGLLLWPLSTSAGHDDATPREQALVRLKLPNRERDRLLLLLATPPPPPALEGAALRRYLAAHPAALLADLQALLAALARAEGPAAAAEFAAGPGAFFVRAAEERARGPALSASELVLGGKDVMQALGLPPGPLVGEVLRELLERVLDDPARNTRAGLLALLPAAHHACLAAREKAR